MQKFGWDVDVNMSKNVRRSNEIEAATRKRSPCHSHVCGWPLYSFESRTNFSGLSDVKASQHPFSGSLSVCHDSQVATKKIEPCV